MKSKEEKSNSTFNSINQIGYIRKVEHYFQNCLNKTSCRYPTTRFHNIDIRYLHGFFLPIESRFSANKINKLFELYLTSDNIIKDINDLFGVLTEEYKTILLPNYLIVKRDGKIMHKSKAQLDALKNEGKSELANKILKFSFETDANFHEEVERKITDISRKNNLILILKGVILVDVYTIARMFRNYDKNHQIAKKVITFTGEGHTQHFVDFFEKELKSNFNKYGNWNNRKLVIEDYSTIFKKCIEVENQIFNNFFFRLDTQQKNIRKYKQEMKRYLTGNTDADRLILLNVGEKELLEICSVPNSQYSEKLCDEPFWYNRVAKYYPATINNKGKKGSWKNYFLTLVYYIDKLKKEYNFEYTKGFPKYYYDILSARYHDFNKAEKAAEIGALDLIIFLEKKGNLDMNFVLRGAAKGNYMDVIKYAEKMGADNWNMGLFGASEGKNISLIKYFENKGIIDWNYGLFGAAHSNDLELINYFINKGATDLYGALKNAAISGSLDVIKKLENTPNINWDEIVLEAAEEGQFDVIKYLSKKPNIDWKSVYDMAQDIENLPLMNFANSRAQAGLRWGR